MPPLSQLDLTAMSSGDAKSAWRNAVRRSRLQRGERRIAEHAQSFKDAVLALPESKDVSCVSIYASRAHEPGTLPLISAFHEAGANVLLPRLGDGLQRCWSIYSDPSDLVERAPGRPPEPSGDLLPQEALADADLIIVPALAADSRGTRLGHGAGWYDRVLADAKPGACVIALVYDDEFHDADAMTIPRESHDVPVAIVVTPSKVVRI